MQSFRKLEYLSLVCAFALPGAAAAWAQAEPSTAAIASRYRELMLTRQLDATKAVCAEDLFFIDPTTDVFEMPLARGIAGVDAVLALEKSWNIGHFDFQPSLAFTSGVFDLAFGALSGDGKAPFPFLNVLRIEEGVVAERIDYGDYTGATAKALAGTGGEILQSVKATGDRYVAVYGHDLASLEASLADDASFQDRTAGILQPEYAKLVSGRATMVAFLRSAFEGIEDLEIAVLDRFYTPSHAVYATRVRFRVAVPTTDGATRMVQAEEPLVIVLEIVDGKVKKHRDFWHAAGYRRQLVAAGET